MTTTGTHRRLGSLGTTRALEPPSVNLLPPSVTERERAGRVAKGVLAVAIAVVGGLVAVWFLQEREITSAEEDRATAQQAEADARAELEPLLVYGTFAEQIEQQKLAIAAAMASDMSFGRSFDAFASAWPSATQTRTLVLDTAQNCAGPDPFTPGAAVACLTFGVTVPDQKAARALLAELGGTESLVDPFLTSANVTEEGTEVDGTVNLDPSLLTHRYDALIEEAAQ
jgi:hypothetical protein